jgi:nucleoside-diphosphate-sugar epimerase
LLKGESGQAYNIANPKAEVSIKHLAETISSLFPERKLRVRYETLINNNEYLKSPITRQIPSIEKAESLGWSPLIDINTGFKRTVLSYDE